MKNRKTFKFREIEEKEELEKFMKLRYRTYFNCSMRNFLKTNDDQIDIDIYDLHSRHFGLFCNDEPAGFMRVVEHKDEIYNTKVYSIGRKYNIFNERDHSKNGLKKFYYPDFPFINHPKIPRSIKTFYDKLKKSGEGLAEASRLMLMGEKGLSKARFLIECGVVLYVLICVGQKHAVINCDQGHERFYRQYGFKTINESEEYHLRGRTTSSSHLLSLSSIPENYHEKFEAMVDEFVKTKQMVREL